MSPTLHPLRAPSELWDGPIVDVDVHVEVPGVEVLRPYLAPVWRQYVDERGWSQPFGTFPYPRNSPASARPEWRPDDGRAPASELSLIQEHILDRGGVEHAILNCLFPIDSGPPDLSVALARAVNDWLVAEWLDADPRLRASIVLPARNDPAAVAAEIDRVGGHPGFVQALLPVRSGMLYGKRLYWPVFEAIERNDLVAGIHWGGSNEGLPPTPSGWPTRYIEEYVSEIQVFESQLINMVAEGLFQKFPALRVSMLEIGFTWVPMWLWDMDRNWKGIRREVPWISRPPFQIVRDHVRFSTAPLDADRSEELEHVLRWLGSDDMVLYASDYPHMHDDDLTVILEAMGEESRAKLMADNARAWYRLDPAETMADGD